MTAQDSTNTPRSLRFGCATLPSHSFRCQGKAKHRRRVSETIPCHTIPHCIPTSTIKGNANRPYPFVLPHFADGAEHRRSKTRWRHRSGSGETRPYRLKHRLTFHSRLKATARDSSRASVCGSFSQSPAHIPIPWQVPVAWSNHHTENRFRSDIYNQNSLFVFVLASLATSTISTSLLSPIFGITGQGSKASTSISQRTSKRGLKPSLGYSAFPLHSSQLDHSPVPYPAETCSNLRWTS